MAIFHYTAVTAEGEPFEGQMEAQSPLAVSHKLQALGYLPIRAHEVATARSRERLGAWLARDLTPERSVPRKTICLLTRELATLLGAGLPLERAFEILIDLTAKRDVQQLLTRILNDLRGGISLSDALEARGKVFPSLYISLVRAGEMGGTLDSTLAHLADHLEKSQALVEEIRSALIYPLLLLTMTGLSIALLMTAVVPEFAPLFRDAGDALPLATRIVIGASDGFAQYWWLMAFVVCGLLGLLHWQLSNSAFRRRWHRLLLWLPLFGDLERKIQVARFSRSLGTLLENGITVITALAVVRQTMTNMVLAQCVEEVMGRLKEGGRLASLLASSQAFPSLAVQLVSVGEETGRLESMLLKVADIYDGEVQITIKRLLSLLVPALTIVLGVVIAAIIASILIALLSINELAI